MKKSKRKYVGITQYFHNYEHGPEGRTHCVGPPSNPYEIKHINNRHLINKQFAMGHGVGGKPQWFKFTVKVDSWYDLLSGVKVQQEDVPQYFRKVTETMRKKNIYAIREIKKLRDKKVKQVADQRR